MMTSTKKPLLRFAPSPSGALHVGNARVALVNWLLARQQGGGLQLRIDDTDQQRCSPHSLRSILEDLAWMGVTHQPGIRQSQRLDIYRDALEALKKSQRAYPCYESEAELAEARRRRRASNKPPVYDRAALALSDEQRFAYQRQGRRPYWRFRLSGGEVRWPDLVFGAMRFDLSSLSDPVLTRSDGRPLLALTAAVDDHASGVSCVVRGADHLANTAAQIDLIRALGGTPPRYGHLPLAHGAGGEAFSKRRGGDLTLKALRSGGVEPMAFCCLLASHGGGGNLVYYADMDALAKAFRLEKLSRAPPQFDRALIDNASHGFLRQMSWPCARRRLKRLSANGAAKPASEPLDETPGERLDERLDEHLNERLWLAIRGNLNRMDDAFYWARVCGDDWAPAMKDDDERDFAAAAADAMPPPPWRDDAWDLWRAALASRTRRRQAALALRLALTGRREGPALSALLPLIGFERARRRLLGRP